MHWFLIILGTLILSISLSNPFYKLLIGKKIKLKLIAKIMLRLLLFIISIVLIFLGLYLESL